MFIVSVLGITLALIFLAFLVSGMHQFCLHCNLYARLTLPTAKAGGFLLLPLLHW